MDECLHQFLPLCSPIPKKGKVCVHAIYFFRTRPHDLERPNDLEQPALRGGIWVRPLSPRIGAKRSWSVRAHLACDGMLSCTRDPQSCRMSHLPSKGRRQELKLQVAGVLFPTQPGVRYDHPHFSNCGSRRPMTNWSTSTMNLSPALAFPPIGSRSRRCSIIDRTKSSSSSCALRANACTVGASIVEYGRNDEDEVEDAIERDRELSFL